MSDDQLLETVAEFTNPHQADVAKMHLEAEGIPAFLHNRNIVESIGLFGSLSGAIRLQVHPDDVERASALLAHASDPSIARGEPDDAFAVVTCLSCGEPLAETDDACSRCGWTYAADDETP